MPKRRNATTVKSGPAAASARSKRRKRAGKDSCASGTARAPEQNEAGAGGGPAARAPAQNGAGGGGGPAARAPEQNGAGGGGGPAARAPEQDEAGGGGGAAARAPEQNEAGGGGGGPDGDGDVEMADVAAPGRGRSKVERPSRA